MAKKAVSNNFRGGHGNRTIELQQTHVEDDSLLPSAEEIQKYHEIDPSIVSWLKARAEKEQDFRHKITNDRMDVVSKNERSNRQLNFTGLIFGFVIIITCMVFSYLLITAGHEIKGSIFLGSTVVFAIGIFVLRNNNKNPESKS